MTYSVIIPIYNEVRTLPKLINQLKSIKIATEIIIIDDGSDDGSEKILENFKSKSLSVFKNITNLGKGASIKKAIEKVKTENIILIDGDLELDIEDIPHLIKKYEKHKKTVVTGIRWDKSTPLKFDINTIGNRLMNYVFNIIYNTNYNDVLCCLKIMNLNTYRHLDIKSNGFEIEVETMAKLALSNFPVKEIKIKYKRRTIDEGKKLKLSDGWKILWAIIYYRVSSN